MVLPVVKFLNTKGQEISIAQRKMNGNKLKPKSLNLNPFLCQPDPIGHVFGS